MPSDALQIINLVFGVIGVGGISGVIVLIYHVGGKVAEAESRFRSLEEKMSSMEELVNHDGIVKSIQDMRINCIGQMSTVLTELKNHESLAGHGNVPEKVAELEARIIILEKD